MVPPSVASVVESFSGDQQPKRLLLCVPGDLRGGEVGQVVARRHLTAPPLTPSYTLEQYVAMQHIKPGILDRELKKGSAELLILSLVEDQPRHGYDLSKLIESRSEGVLKFRVASLYPLLCVNPLPR